MANFSYDIAALTAGTSNVSSWDLRVMLCMTNTTADTANTAATLSALTLDECDGATYARVDLAGIAWATDAGATPPRAEQDFTDAAWATLGVGTRQNQGMLIYLHVTNDTDSIPLFWIDTGGFPFDGNGSAVTAQWNAEGVWQLINDAV